MACGRPLLAQAFRARVLAQDFRSRVGPRLPGACWLKRFVGSRLLGACVGSRLSGARVFSKTWPRLSRWLKTGVGSNELSGWHYIFKGVVR